MSIRRFGFPLLCAFAFGVSATAFAQEVENAVPAAAAGVTQPDPAASAETTHYAIGERVCKPAKRRHATCFVMRRVEVTESTPGARPYKLAAGASLSPAATRQTQTIGPAGGMTPYDFQTAYNFKTTGGTGQTIALVDAYNDPNIASDLATFDTEYGLPACTVANKCLKVVNQTGGSTLPSNDTTGWSVEESLDVEAAHAICPNCHILLVEVNSSSAANLAAGVNEAVKLGATVISNSYGGPEADLTSTENAAYNHSGVVITASTGDDGYYSYDQFAAVDQANGPSSLPTVVAVGGTSLFLSQTGTRQSETVWNDNGTYDYFQSLFGFALGATGGGCSNLFTAQPWQSNLSNWAATACGTHRLPADVSADADPITGLDVYDTFNCGTPCPTQGWQTVGGTSLSSPLIAGLFALAGGAHGVEYPARTLYGHLGTSSLFNVTTGGNGWCGGEGAAACGDPNTLGVGDVDCDFPGSGSTPSAGDAACDAGPGYNGPTGVGTPNGLGAFAGTGPTAKIAGPTSVVEGKTNTWTATTTDPFPKGKVISFSWNWGDGTAATVTTTGSVTHDYATSGTDTITLTVKDNYGVTGTATDSVTVTP
ncbi:putative Subtilase family serine protease [Candidatus Sulfotelmatobacter kueseliae]|uniref:Putative Subtilase family serine protease n=1 Tax=Candidatus Sulfotelmatobacter kueseliae TaxID=2042962 RepID=A0A2U3L954_9BACT|nr:putative Subtilase family serine protease [Candidatus Sulfotelmatobacter kueseliae]